MSFICVSVLFCLCPVTWAATSDYFITTWKTDNKGTSSPTSITIPTVGSGYVYDVDWNNDGTFEQLGITGNVTHDFGKAGIYTIRIRGRFPRIFFITSGDKEKILSVDQWGRLHWSSMANAFDGAANVVIKASDAPDLSGVTDMNNTFRDASALTTLGKKRWDVSSVTNMHGMFSGAKLFKGGGGIEHWETGNVRDMSFMFYKAASFNGDLGKWNTRKVVTMRSMFNEATLFNSGQDNGYSVGTLARILGVFRRMILLDRGIGRWDTSHVTDMAFMFRKAFYFNQDLGRWDTRKVTAMQSMFCDALVFNGGYSRSDARRTAKILELLQSLFLWGKGMDQWDTGHVEDMEALFYGAVSFDRPIGHWNTGRVKSMVKMFAKAVSFNRNISQWDTHQVVNMSSMFYKAASFNQPIGHWNIAGLTQATFMFKEAGLSVENYDDLLIGWNKQKLKAGVMFDAGNSKYNKGGKARANIIAKAQWVIVDGGATQNSECSPTTATSYMLHGVKIKDKYLWMEDSQSEELQKWVDKQNCASREFLDNLKERRWLTQQFQNPGRNEESVRLELLQSKRVFYWRKNVGETYKVYCTRASSSAPEEILVNPNLWKNNHYIDNGYASPDGRYMAYVETIGGDHDGVIRIIDVKTKALLSDQLMGSWQAMCDWDGDSKGFYYCTNGSKNVGQTTEDKDFWISVYHHRLGTSGEDRKVFYDRTHKDYIHGVVLSEDKNYLMLYRGQNGGKNELFVQTLNPEGPVMPVVKGLEAYYYGDIYKDKLFIQTNSQAPNGQVFITEVNHPAKAYWKLFLPEQESVLQRVIFADQHVYAVYLKHACTQIKIYDFNGKFIREIPLPGMGTASVYGYWLKGPVYIDYVSFLHPPATYTYDFKANKLTLIKEDSSARFCDFSDLEVKQVWYRSKDNTPISMFLVQRKNLIENGTHPVILEGYGGFNHPQTPGFNGYSYHLMKQGVVFAYPNLRGGGEYGEKWHQAGMKEKKQNTIDDYIGAAEWLIANHYTNPTRLAALGGSNGGLTVAAAMMQRPELFKVVVCESALLDMLRYQRFNYADIWKDEYGTSENEDEFKYLLRYSPYHNVKGYKTYPDILFTVGKEDVTVALMHSFKMVAKMQDPIWRNKVFLAVYDDIGHQGGNVDTVVNKAMDKYTFLLNELNVEVQDKK